MKQLSKIWAIDAGLMDYGKAWDLQKWLHDRVLSNEIPGAIIFVEHPDVITMGKNAVGTNLLFSPEAYRQMGISYYEIDRGGEVTAHMPGQLVVYPILNLPELGLGARAYVNTLENAVIKVLESYGISARTDEKYPGVWAGQDKVCAVGVRIKQRVTMHGIGFNICNSFDIYRKIVPCGIRERGVTSLERLIGRPVATKEVAEKFRDIFCQTLRLDPVPQWESVTIPVL